MAYAAGHVVIATLVARTPLWTARFWAQVVAVPAVEAAILGLLLSRERRRRERGARQ
jgi:hypothetical protein